jgi:recombination protein RecR
MSVVDKLPSLQLLLRHLQKVPYLASKNLYRVATHFLQMDEKQLRQFCDMLLRAHEHVVRCDVCCAWQEKGELCQFCSSTRRDLRAVCIVESWQDLLSIEKSGAFRGLYHVLGGVLSPLDGIGSEHLSIDKLITRIDAKGVQSEGEVGPSIPVIQELIFALNQTPEGEATTAYIVEKIKHHTHLKITCLAQGMPVGASIEFMDRLTVYKALDQRKEF